MDSKKVSENGIKGHDELDGLAVQLGLIDEREVKIVFRHGSKELLCDPVDVLGMGCTAEQAFLAGYMMRVSDEHRDIRHETVFERLLESGHVEKSKLRAVPLNLI